MNCYNHPKNSAVGICRACGRGVCSECDGTPEAPFLSCSIKCAEKNAVLEQINNKATQVYGLGDYKRSNASIPTSAAAMFILGIAFFIMVFVGSDHLTDPSVYPILIIVIGFFCVGLFTWHRSKKRGIDF